MNDFFTNRSCHTNHLFRKILKQIIFIAFLFLFSMCIQDDPEEVFSLKPGDSLPGFSVQDNKGGLISNTILKGKISVIAFVNTGCPDCRKELPEIEKAYQQFRDDESIRFIARRIGTTRISRTIPLRIPLNPTTTNNKPRALPEPLGAS